MNTETKKSLFHVLLSFLLAVGIALPLSFTLSFEKYWPVVLLVSFLIPALFTLLSGHKKVSIIVITLFVLSQLISAFLLPYGGPILSSLASTGKAFFLFLKGQKDALPLFAFEFTVILSIIIAVIAYFLSKEGNGFFPALSILLFSMMALWYIGKPALIVFTLPAIVATVLIYIRQANEDLSPWRILPIVIIITLLSFFILPTNRMTIKPLESAADKIRETITNYLFFTQTRTVFSLDDEGYHMGGPAEPNDEPVMQIISPQKVYLRGAIKNRYTGLSWIDTTGGQRHLYNSPRWTKLKEQIFDSTKPEELIRQQYPWLTTTFPVSVEMISSSASTLFISQRFEKLSAAGGMVPYFNLGSEVFITRNLYPQDKYQFTSRIFESSNDALIPIVNGLESIYDPEYEGILNTYTKLPDHMEKSLYDLVGEITKSSATDYDKALAIENHLNRYYTYTLTPEPVAENMDFVSYFIHVGKEGYCTYFASAMTTFAQMIGLPARYVEGYLAVPGENGVAYVTGENAHAWSEIYFPNFGWVIFDATPGETPPPPDPPPSSSQSNSSTENDPATTPSPEDADPQSKSGEDATENETPTPSPPPVREEPNVESEPEKNNLSILWLIVLLAILIFISAIVLRIYYTLPRTAAKRAKTLEIKYFVWIQAIYDLLRINNLVPMPQESPMAFAVRCNYVGDYSLSLVPLARQLSFVGYSPHPVREEFVVSAKETFESLYTAYPWYKKIRFILTRAFLPKKNRNSHVPSIKQLKKVPLKQQRVQRSKKTKK